jgi:hypothetical protein
MTVPKISMKLVHNFVGLCVPVNVSSQFWNTVFSAVVEMLDRNAFRSSDEFQPLNCDVRETTTTLVAVWAAVPR